MSARRCRAIWRGWTSGCARPGYRGPTADHPVAWRRGADRRSRRGSPPAPCCRDRPAASPAAVYAARLLGARRPDPVRHGRHQHRHLPDRRRRADAGQRPRRSAAIALALNSLDIASLGAGGGSIARVDAGGILHVGPESAGAMPGPGLLRPAAARAPTVTDANLVLGYLDPAQLPRRPRRLDRGGGASARSTRRWRAARHRPLAAAEGVAPRRQHQHGRGHPAGLGAARRRSAALRAAGVRRRRRAARRPTSRASSSSARVVVPRVAAVLSAWGMLATDLRFEVSRTHIGDAGAARRRRGQAPVRRDGGRGLRAAARLVRRAGARAALGRHALRRADLRDHRAARRRRSGRAPTRCRRSSSGSTAATRSSTPTRCATRRPCWSTRAWPSSACCPGCRQTSAVPRRRRWRLAGAAARLAAAAGARCRSIALDALAPGRRSTARRSFESAMTTVLLRDAEQATVTPHGWLDIQLS